MTGRKCLVRVGALALTTVAASCTQAGSYKSVASYRCTIIIPGPLHPDVRSRLDDPRLFGSSILSF